MSADFREQIEDLKDQAYELPDGPSKLALFEEAVRLADSHQDAELGDEVRSDLIRTATFSGYPEKALVAFSWRLAQADRDPDNFFEEDLLWEYKWIVDSLTGFPQITRKQIEDMLDDIERRSERTGSGSRAIHKLRCQIAMDMCEPVEARKHHRRWEKTPRDANSDCAACEQNHCVRFQLFIGKKEKALELAQPILRGSMRCAEIPHATYAILLLPLLQMGEAEKAVEYHHKGYRLISNNRKFLDEVGDHLTFLVLTDNLPRALKLFEKHVEWAWDSRDLYWRWKFYLAVHFLFGRVAESGKPSLKLRLPKALPCHREEGRYEVADLSAWVEGTCRDLAQRFDARNGNDGFTRRLSANGRLKRWLTPTPLC
jgi:tetratricopeptide (TPR) repeat protein